MSENSYQKASSFTKSGLKDEASKVAQMLGVSLPSSEGMIKETKQDYTENVSLSEIINIMKSKGMRISERFIRRYHLSLNNKGFVILSGVSGTGKTWLTELYASSIGAECLIVPVAPNWTSNEDLLGFYNPLDRLYRHTEFSQFLQHAQNEYEKAKKEKRKARPYHIVLDEMNLARVEYYFATFLSLLEIRNRGSKASIVIPPDDQVILTPNLYFIGTINVDETTHGFADKVYDRAQLIEVQIEREDILEFIGKEEYGETLIQIWDTVNEIAPFAYRVIGDMKKYILDSSKLGVQWQFSLDEQVLQKILPKVKIIEIEDQLKITELKSILETAELELSLRKVEEMLERYTSYGVATYF